MTAKTPVLCCYDIEVIHWGWIIQGAKMIHVSSSDEIVAEFDRQMAIDIRGELFWPRKIRRWRMTSYLPATPLE